MNVTRTAPTGGRGRATAKYLHTKTAPKSASGNRHGLNADTKKEQSRHGFTVYPKNRKTTYSQNITDYAQKLAWRKMNNGIRTKQGADGRAAHKRS